MSANECRPPADLIARHRRLGWAAHTGDTHDQSDDAVSLLPSRGGVVRPARRLLRAAVLVVMICAALSFGVSATSAAVPANRPQPAAKLTVSSADGRRFHQGATIRADSTLTAVVLGFAPDASVDVWLIPGGHPNAAARANAQGALHLHYRVPTHLAPGKYILAISGEPAPTTNTAAMASGGAVVEASVPNIALVHFAIGR
jgi:hypothetical protein